jgi:Flp pilus assembly protein TadG
MLPVIIMFCGLSIDVGLLELMKLRMQTAADAAALGAELDWERGQGNEGIQGRADAAANGFTDGVNGVTVNISNPPWSGDYTGRTDTQYVTITQTVNTIFMRALNGGKATVSVSAVALEPPLWVFDEHCRDFQRIHAERHQQSFDSQPRYVLALSVVCRQERLSVLKHDAL